MYLYTVYRHPEYIIGQYTRWFSFYTTWIIDFPNDEDKEQLNIEQNRVKAQRRGKSRRQVVTAARRAAMALEQKAKRQAKRLAKKKERLPLINQIQLPKRRKAKVESVDV